MRDYHERLRVPVAWWLIGGLCVVILGPELFAGFSVAIAAAVYGVLTAACAATLLHWGGAVVSVTGGELRAAGVRLPVGAAGEVRPLDENQTRAMRGPRADPAAYMLIRPYLKQSVYVEVTGVDARWPYLLIGTRQPARLAEAIERSRTATAAQDQR
jgi:Protein of unknown function (DUF3093)